ncbi:zinc ribbon domain-containing protein [Nocardia salmonicida]|uniref:Zn-ribbon domain-containing OB-fold protein n=1 Tax=Nocardia salmonicida TaxID=53431 RepID=UPI0033CFB10F
MSTNFADVLPLRRDQASALFFDGTARGELLLQRCSSCRHWNTPEIGICARCRSSALEWTRSTGLGHVVTWAVVHDRSDPHMRRVVGIVELVEGPWMRGQLRASAESVWSGITVTTDFVSADGGESIPVFTPVEDRNSSHEYERKSS